MTNFITDETELAFPKTARRIRTDIPAEEQIRHTDWNAVCQALYDTREYIIDEVVPNLGGGASPTDNVVDLSRPPYSMVAGNSTTGVKQANTAALLDAIADNTGLRKILYLPQGDWYLEQDGTNNWFAKFGAGQSGALVGAGPSATKIILDAVGDGGESAGIELDQCNGVYLANFAIEHGVIQKPDPVQRNFLIRVNNTHAGGGGDAGKTRNVVIENIRFGKTFGDALAFQGGTASDNIVNNIVVRNIHMSLFGRTMRSWTPATAYTVNDQVDNTVITCATVANLDDADYITLTDNTGTVVMYEFDKLGNGVTAGRVQVNVSTDTTAIQVATRLRTAILANQTALGVTANGDGTLTVTGIAKATENVAHASFTISARSYVCTTSGTSAASVGPATSGAGITDGTCVWSSTNGIRFAARCGFSFQKGYDGVYIDNVYIEKTQNSQWDMESTGVGTRKNLHARNVTLDNRGGNTSICASLGSTSAGIAEDHVFDNFTLYEGRLQHTYTKNSSVINAKIIVTQAFPADTTLALFEGRGTNEDLRIVNADFQRLGGGNGMLVDIENGSRVTIDGGRFIQNTISYPIFFDGTDHLTIKNGPLVHYKTGSGASSFAAVTINAVGANATQPLVQGLEVVCDTGLMRAAVEFQVRSPRSLTNITVTDVRAQGEASIGVLTGVGTTGTPVWDRAPFFSNIQAATPWQTVDQSDNPYTGILCPRERLWATDFGAKGDGTTDDSTALLTAITHAATHRTPLYFPPGTYVLTRNGSNSYCLDVNVNNVILQGSPGQTFITCPAGMPATSVSLLRFDEQENITIRDIVFDGNWGNHVTEIAAGSDRVALPQATIHVESTGDMPTSGTFKIQLSNGTLQTITYTGKTSTTFTGCTGGTGTMFRHDVVGYIDTNTNGINHTSQGINPSNFGVMLRGCKNVLIENCTFRDMYGDGVWMGTPADDDLQQLTYGVRILGCTFEICARNAISFGGAAHRLEVTGCTMRWIHNTLVDSEPQYLYNGAVDVSIHDNLEMRGWWPRDKPAILISVVAGDTTGYNLSSAARGWRIVRNAIYGSIQVDGAKGVTIASNRIENAVTDAAYAYAPVWIAGVNDAVAVYDNDIDDYAAISVGSSGPHLGAIQVQFNGNGSHNAQPAGIQIYKNRIRARNGARGIWINSQGGQSYGLNPVSAPVTGTATAVSATSLTDTSKSWTNDEFKGRTVIMGGVTAMVASNTGTVLTLQPGHPVVEPYAWRQSTGRPALTPALGTYEIKDVSGFLDIDDNQIDCGGDGAPAGSDGIYLFNDRAGGRIRVRNNTIKNCGTSSVNGWGIQVVGDTSVPALHIEITGNRVWDDQAVATTAACVRFASAASLTSIGKLIMRDNGQGGGANAVPALSGVSAGKWLLNDGPRQDWEGYGVPSHSAPRGSSYFNLNGTGADSFYVNTDGGTTWSAR